MAISAEAVTVADEATALNDGTPGRVVVSVPEGGEAVYLGGDDVDTTNGFPVAAEGVITVLVDAGEVLYAVVASGTQSVNVLRS
jgi:hypothetical protein